MNYQVGQIVYIRIPKVMRILPAQICEEVVTKTLDGQNISYSCKFPGKSETFDLEDVEGKIYTDLELLKSELINNAIDGIEKICSEAQKLAEKQFSIRQQVITSAVMDNQVDNIVDEDAVRIDLGNGQVGIFRQV